MLKERKFCKFNFLKYLEKKMMCKKKNNFE